MTAISPKPENATWVSPYLTVQDADIAIEFYAKAFNFTIIEKTAGDDGSTWHGELQYKDQLIMLGKAGAYGGTSKPPVMTGVESPISQYIYTEDVDAFHNNAVTAGAKSLGEPENMFWGDRMCRLQDPDGYIWCFATKVAPCPKQNS